MSTQPTTEMSRIESLDVLRGFALLGILLLNIIGFGLLFASYSNPALDLAGASTINWVTWSVVDIGAEGAMRTLSIAVFSKEEAVDACNEARDMLLRWLEEGVEVLPEFGSNSNQ